MNDISYIEDETQWGKSIKLSLLDIINEYMAGIQQDDVTHNVQRHQVHLKARNILAELYFDIVKEIKAIKLEVNPLLKVILPEDFVSLVRLSYVDDKGNVYMMTQNTNNTIARDYLQAHDYHYLFDDSGEILEGDGTDDKNLKVEEDDQDKCITIPKEQKLFYNGTFVVQGNEGVIHLSSDLSGFEIILEYISDGLEHKQPSQIFIHKFAKQALINGIHYELIKNRRNIPEYTIRAARKEYYNSRRKAKGRINAMSYNELFRTLTQYT